GFLSDLGKRLVVRKPDYWNQQPFFNGYSHPDMDMVVISDLVSEPGRIRLWILSQCCGSCFDYHIVEGNLNRRKLIHALTGLNGFVHVDFHGKVEMRRAEFAFRKAFGDHLSHLGYFLLPV